MATDEIERLHYYQKQYLGAADFEAQQRYHRDMRRRHNIAHHTWGIVTGLDLVEKPNECDPKAVDIFISPGMAIDGFGREIVVFEPAKIEPELFDRFINLKHRSVWLAYDQRPTEYPRAGYQVCASDDYARIEETFRIVVEPDPPTHDPVDLAGNPVEPPEIPADESVPEQELPDDADQPLWLVCLGFVNWDGVDQKLVPGDPDKVKNRRRYVGAVCEQVIGPAGKLILRDRTAPEPLPADNKAPGYAGVDAEVQGSLQVDRLLTAKQDEEIHGGRLRFQNRDGEDDGVPLWMSRRRGPKTPGTADLRVHIGDRKIGESDASGSRFTVGNFAANGTDEAVIFDVKGDDTVDIPTGVLDFGTKKRQMVNLKRDVTDKPVHGVGVQNDSTYFRTSDQFCWFQGGVHSDNAGESGGGTVQLRLNNGGLHFGEVFQQMLNLWKAEYGIGTQNGALYFRSPSEFCWYRGGIHNTQAEEPGGGGTLVMKLDDVGDLTLTTSLKVKGKLSVGDNLSVDGNVTVDGNLTVKGDQNLMKVMTLQFNLVNVGFNAPGVWSMPHAGEFSKVYARYAVLQGFTVLGPVATTFPHDSNPGKAIQHVFVLVDDANSNEDETVGTCYTSQADGIEDNNYTLFTVVVIGKGVT